MIKSMIAHIGGPGRVFFDSVFPKFVCDGIEFRSFCCWGRDCRAGSEKDDQTERKEQFHIVNVSSNRYKTMGRLRVDGILAWIYDPE